MKYSIPATLIVGCISLGAFAGDLTKKNNDFRNEMALGYQFGFNDNYNIALEVFGQKNKDALTRVNNFAYIEEPTPVDDNEIWGLNDGRTDLDWSTGVRLRPGYNVTSNTRLFLDGGVVWGDFSMELTDSSDGVGAAYFDEDPTVKSDMLRGWRYGAGIEHHLESTKNLSLILDYSMTDFESATGGYSMAGAATSSSSDNLTGPAYQQVMLSLKADFDAGLQF